MTIVYVLFGVMGFLLLATMDHHAAKTRKRLEEVEERLEDVENVLADLKAGDDLIDKN